MELSNKIYRRVNSKNILSKILFTLIEFERKYIDISSFSSISSHDENIQHPIFNHIGGCQPPDDVNYNLSEDEETGIEPAFEYNNKSMSNTESSKDNGIEKEEENPKGKENPDDELIEDEIVEAGKSCFCLLIYSLLGRKNLRI